MHDIREWIQGERRIQEPLLRIRPRKTGNAPSTAAEEESFAGLAIRRDAVRQANHRSNDRHHLQDGVVVVEHHGRHQSARLVNLSGGGAMIEGALGLQLWDEVTLQLGSSGKVSAAVRWLRGDRIGVEFAEETRIEGQAQETARLVAEITRRRLLDRDTGDDLPKAEDRSPQPHPVGQEVRAEPIGDEKEKREPRHALIWSGNIHYDYETIPVRLRNVSSGGALIECGRDLAVGSELLLELDKAGTFFATVKWTHGDIAGLLFHLPFDIQCLAAARVIPAHARWTAPEHVRSSSADSVWERQRRTGEPGQQTQIVARVRTAWR